ncbi:hypothetical protein BGZ61DRAFT_184371 [Ilyonectria robusta]|uniref:uncharacterized protein n=1 Tax=Ilyonectria robusta TaxID=1079257 RepID=UPI001E8D8616|nr:uncharacterized protein BGZ61DRAFT_184371 [Ilyonectria robusta]KAH8729584.1 hypothetical protein BGZ61DRAFT_184371 [Ilyonectria robusta]
MWLDATAAKFPLTKLERDAATLILRASLRRIAGKGAGDGPHAHMSSLPVQFVSDGLIYNLISLRGSRCSRLTAGRRFTSMRASERSIAASKSHAWPAGPWWLVSMADEGNNRFLHVRSSSNSFILLASLMTRQLPSFLSLPPFLPFRPSHILGLSA